MHPDVVQRLLEIRAPRLVYVSCNPATQARDLELLDAAYQRNAGAAGGYVPAYSPRGKRGGAGAAVILRLMAKQQQPVHIFLQSVISAVSIIIAGVFLLFRSHETRSDMSTIVGPLLEVKMELAGHPDRHIGKLRYLKIGGYSKYFEVFVGKDWGDFSPAYERIDSLKTGEILTVYHSADHTSNESTDDELINRDTQFIDKQSQPYFIRGSKDRYFSYFAIGMGTGLVISLFILRKKNIVA